MPDIPPLDPDRMGILNYEPRCPVVLVLDTSGSMSGAPIQALNDGLRTFADDLKKDDIAPRRVEVAVVIFGPVRVVQDFVEVADFEPPVLEASGRTPLGEAMITALDLIQERKQWLDENGLNRYRAWLWLFTDGLATDDTSEAAKRVAEATENHAVIVRAFGVGQFDEAELAQLAPKRAALTGIESFAKMFEYMSKSHKVMSHSNHTVDVPEDEQGPVELPTLGSWAKEF